MSPRRTCRTGILPVSSGARETLNRPTGTEPGRRTGKMPVLRGLLLVLLMTYSLSRAAEPVRLLTLDPGHFHAALVQKFMYPEVSPVVHVYSPQGQDLADHLKRIEAFNTRPENPTRWQEQVYTGPDFLKRMTRDKAGNVVVLAGNNTRKTKYLYQSVDAGFNVLADK